MPHDWRHRIPYLGHIVHSRLREDKFVRKRLETRALTDRETPAQSIVELDPCFGIRPNAVGQGTPHVVLVPLSGTSCRLCGDEVLALVGDRLV